MLSGRERMIGVSGGALGLAGILLFIGVAVASLLSIRSAEGSVNLLEDPVILPALRFTLLQAGLSTLLSLLFAIPVAMALARRRRFPGRQWLVRLMAVPMGLPVLIGALGLIGIWGRTGLVNDVARLMGATSPFSIYGLGGILLAHVFFNMPLAARLLLAGLERIPGEYWLMAAELGMKPPAVFRFIEWPTMRRLLPGAAGLVFMLCATSFTLVLVLGGGPSATTIEVAIYQALRFDFDPGRAVSLAFLQIVVTALILGAMALFPAPADTGSGSGRPGKRFDGEGRGARLADGCVLAIATAFLCLPLLSIVVTGLGADFGRLVRESSVQRAAITSLLVSASAGGLSVLLGVLLIRAMGALQDRRMSLPARSFSSLLSAVSSLVLLVPTVVLATGWFMVLRSFGEVAGYAPAVVVGINALMALPFVMRVLRPAFVQHLAGTGRLAASLGIRGWARLRLVDFPVLWRPLAMALSFAMALSLGDLGAVALFGSQNVMTLPWLIYSRMGSYRTVDADGLALLLGLMCLALTMAGTAGNATPTPATRKGGEPE